MTAEDLLLLPTSLCKHLLKGRGQMDLLTDWHWPSWCNPTNARHTTTRNIHILCENNKKRQNTDPIQHRLAVQYIATSNRIIFPAKKQRRAVTEAVYPWGVQQVS